MKAGFAALLCGLVLLLATLQSARAEAVISFSVPGNAYGWCAGYAKSYAESCAQKTCASSGGADCQIVADCTGGWGAVALSANSKIVGVGATCHGDNAYSVRAEALASCIVASRALCWTYSTFSPRGSLQPKDQDFAFDLDWYAQNLLSLLSDYGGKDDGDFGAASKQALQKFQADIGRTPDGVVNQELVDRLLDVAGGFTALVPAIQKGYIDTRSATITANAYGYAAAPSTAATFGDELNAQTPDEQRVALATMLAARRTKCSIPATSATALPGSGGMAWNVTCAEGQYAIVLNNDGSAIISPGAATPAGSNAEGQAASLVPDSQVAPLAPVTQSPTSQSLADGMQPLPPEGPTAQPAPPQAPPAPSAPMPPSISVNAFVRGAGLQTSCPATSPNNIACVAYVQGVLDAFVAAAAMKGNPQQLCLPIGETAPEIAQLIGDYMANHSELQQTGGPAVILQALNEKLPCKAQ